LVERCLPSWWLLDSTSYKFSEGIGKKVGDGLMTSFWLETWIGNTPLRVQYPRLFQVSVQNNSKVREMGTWVEGEWVGPKMEEEFVCWGGWTTR
jgi:hypothetical protein